MQLFAIVLFFGAQNLDKPIRGKSLRQTLNRNQERQCRISGLPAGSPFYFQQTLVTHSPGTKKCTRGKKICTDKVPGGGAPRTPIYMEGGLGGWEVGGGGERLGGAGARPQNTINANFRAPKH